MHTDEANWLGKGDILNIGLERRRFFSHLGSDLLGACDILIGYQHAREDLIGDQQARNLCPNGAASQ